MTGTSRLSRACYRTMLQNLGSAAGYNLVLTSTSTIVVALTAQLLRRVQPTQAD